MALTNAQRHALVKQVDAENAVSSYVRQRVKFDENSKYGNLTRFLNKERKEHEDHIQAHKTEETTALREKEIEQEKDLARKMNDIKHNEIKDMKLRQQLRENCEELRELERALKNAYVQKELAAQIAEKREQTLNEKIQEKKQIEKLQKAYTQVIFDNKVLAEKEILKKISYRHELQDQMILREKSKRYLYDEYLKEKKMIDEIIERIHEEDEREAIEKMCKMRKTKEEMQAFSQAQEIWKNKKKEEIEEENMRIKQYLMTIANRDKASLQEKQDREARKLALSESIAKQIFEEEAQKRQREEIIQELLVEEEREAIEERHRKEVEKQLRQRLEVRESLTQQMRDKLERKRQQAQSDAALREQLMAKMIEDNRLEQLSDQKRRMKMLQFKRDIEQMMIERRQRNAMELQTIRALKEHEEIEKKERLRIIEEERLRMLKDHCKNLIGYLPKGMLRPEDLQHLPADFMG